MRFSDLSSASLFFFNSTPTTQIYTLSLHDALPICHRGEREGGRVLPRRRRVAGRAILILKQSLRPAGAGVERALASPAPPVVGGIVHDEIEVRVIAVVAELVVHLRIVRKHS